METSSSQNGKMDLEDKYSSVLYVADLPNETTSEDLQKIFKDYHFLYASLINSKNNQIFSQVYLENKEWATKARHELNGYILKPMNGANSIKEGKPIRICKYEGKGHHIQNNIKQSLLVKNIDNKMTQKEFYKIFLEYGDIVSAKIEYDENGISKGFGYIYYYQEESAENAKKNINGKIYYDKMIEIVNLIPGKKTKSNAITLFVLNIPFNITEKELTPIFEQFGPVSNISVNPKGFAYVSFNSFECATKCLRKMKEEPFAFPGMPNIVVKFASSKEERDANKNFMKNNENNVFMKNVNLNVQFNCIYLNREIKSEIDLDKEIRLFIKIVMFTDFNPKEVLVDFQTMSGLVTFGNYHDYNLFFKKYQEYCTNQNPYFECIPYNFPQSNKEEKIKNENDIYYNNNTPNPYDIKNKIETPDSFNFEKPNNINDNKNQNINDDKNEQEKENYDNKPYDKDQNKKQKKNNNKYYYNKNNNNYYNYSNNKYYYNNKNYKRQNYNNYNNYNYNYNNKKYNQKNNNNNNNNNNNKKYIFRPGDNFDLTNMKMSLNMLGQNNGNPFFNLQMSSNKEKDKDKDIINNINNDLNGLIKNDKNDKEIIDERNLQKLNPSQLLSQFNKPPVSIYENMFSSEEQEEIRREIADTIYEIVYAKYPDEAEKITGMINEKGIEKMNMLLSKKEDLNDVIDKAYEMIVNNKDNKDNKEKSE